MVIMGLAARGKIADEREFDSTNFAKRVKGDSRRYGGNGRVRILESDIAVAS
jgi:hypothetical protein